MLAKVCQIKVLSSVLLLCLSQPGLYAFKIYYVMACPLGTGISGGLVQTFTGPSGASALGLGVQVCKARPLPTSGQTPD